MYSYIFRTSVRSKLRGFFKDLLTFRRSKDSLLAIGAGSLLAWMIQCNSLLASHTSPVFASWIAHLIGALVAFTFVAFQTRLGQENSEPAYTAQHTPIWFYLGGLPGACTVIVAAETVNSRLKLSGTISLMILGQILYGIVADYFGLFALPKRCLRPIDFGIVLCLLTGSALMIFGRP